MWEAEAGGSPNWASLGYRVRPCLKKQMYLCPLNLFWSEYRPSIKAEGPNHSTASYTPGLAAVRQPSAYRVHLTRDITVSFKKSCVQMYPVSFFSSSE
jgi:hypothetical protein